MGHLSRIYHHLFICFVDDQLLVLISYKEMCLNVSISVPDQNIVIFYALVIRILCGAGSVIDLETNGFCLSTHTLSHHIKYLLLSILFHV